MSRTKRRVLGLTTVLTVALALGACGSGNGDGDPGGGEANGADPITLRYAFFAPPTSFPGVQMEEWANQLNERTDGQVTVELFPGGTLLAAGDIYDGVTEGVVDVGLDSPAYDAGRFPFSSVMAVPVGIDNAEVASRTFYDLLTEYEPAEFEGYQIITAFTSEPAYIQTVNPVRSRDDIAGMSLRSPGALVPILQGLGANGIGMSMAEVAEALNTGVIEGYMTSREVLQDFGLAETVKYVTDYPYGVTAFVAVMDQERFDALPEDVRDTILELGEEMMLFAAQYHDQENVQPALEWAESEHGLEIVGLEDGEQEAWDQVAEDYAIDWTQSHVDADFDADEVLDRMRALAETHAGS